MPRINGSVKVRERASWGSLEYAQALADVLCTLIECMPDAPTFRRVHLRTHLAMLKRAYPEVAARSDLDTEQFLAEEDGYGVSEDP